jgi:hypothetical protein
VAPHLDISTSASIDSDQSSKLNTQKYHPFLGFRIRGLVHSIPTPVAAATSDNGFSDWELDGGIPGFQRIIMVLYQPTIRHLVSVWEHACEEFGDVFQQTISGQMVQDINNGVDGLTTAGGGLNAEEYEKRCKEKLRQGLGRVEWQRGPLMMGREWVEIVEDRYSEARGLNWVSSALACRGRMAGSVPGCDYLGDAMFDHNALTLCPRDIGRHRIRLRLRLRRRHYTRRQDHDGPVVDGWRGR